MTAGGTHPGIGIGGQGGIHFLGGDAGIPGKGEVHPSPHLRCLEIPVMVIGVLYGSGRPVPQVLGQALQPQIAGFDDVGVR